MDWDAFHSKNSGTHFRGKEDTDCRAAFANVNCDSVDPIGSMISLADEQV